MTLPTIDHFSASEFPSRREINLTDPRLFYTLETLREELGYPIYPSPVKGALAREYGSEKSKHYAIGKLSTAIDFFPDCDIVRALLTTCHYFGGVGLYFDTNYKGRKWIMFHGDLRQKQTLWYRQEGIYHTIKSDKDYWQLISLIKKRRGV